MPTSDPLDILLTHDHWATRQLLDACAKLTPEQFHHPFDIGPGSLHAATSHLLAAMRAWTDMLAGREQRPRLDAPGSQHTPAELQSLLDEIAADLWTLAHTHALDEIVTRIRGGKSYSFTRGGVLTHVTTHGMHHRAQCLNMLRQLGVTPLPASAVVEWMIAVDFPQA